MVAHPDVATALDDARSTEARLAKLEEQLKAPKRKDVWEKLQAISPLASGLVLALVGYFLTGAVTVRLQQQQLDLSNVKEMRDQLAVMVSQKSQPEDLQAAAFTLSAFGAPAVAPLVGALITADQFGDNRRNVIADALRTMGLTRPDAVCEPLLKILDNHTGRFRWTVHMVAIQIIGDLECPSAGPAIQCYNDVVSRVAAPSDLPTYAVLVAATPEVDMIAIDQLKQELQRTLRIIGAH